MRKMGGRRRRRGEYALLRQLGEEAILEDAVQGEAEGAQGRMTEEMDGLENFGLRDGMRKV